MLGGVEAKRLNTHFEEVVTLAEKESESQIRDPLLGSKPS
jgi:hypothetical protein